MKSEIYFPNEDSYFLTKSIKEEISKFSNKNLDSTFLEIGSGSGIQLETFLKLGIKKQNIFSCDINSYSVKHCKKLGFNCVHSNLFENIRGRFGIIIFNPPYLPIDSSEPENSIVATTGGKLGSEVINEFLKQARYYLKRNGKIFLLTSSLSGKINFLDYKKRILAKKKLFFEELYVWELKITTE